MTEAARAKLIAVAVVCIPYALFCATIYAINLSKQPAQDWMVYYSAVRAYLDGNLPLIFDGERLTEHLNSYFADWLSRPLTYHPWLYPPSFLLLLLPFGVLSFGMSWAVFQATTFGALVAAIWLTVDRAYRRWLQVASLLFAPAALYTVGTGQNSFLTTALLVGGFGLLRRHPIASGVLLGLLTYKPQLWMMVPVALVAAAQLRILAVAVATAAMLAGASLVVIGPEAWSSWLGMMMSPNTPAAQQFIAWNRLSGEAIYTNLIAAGAPSVAANIGQAVAGLLAASAVWWSYRRGAGEPQLIVLLAATVIAAPHVSIYDTVLLVVAATLLFAHGLETGFRRGELIVPVLVWMIQFWNPPTAYPIGLMTPVLTVLLIACAIARISSSERSGIAIDSNAAQAEANRARLAKRLLGNRSNRH